MEDKLPPVVPEAQTTVQFARGDFDGDGEIDAADIDSLFAAVHAGTNDPAFELIGDALVDQQDVDELILNILGTQYGDSNLDGAIDGAVDGGDLSLMAANWLRTDGVGWADGDFTGNGAVDGADLSLMAANWLWQRPAAVATASAEPIVTAVEASKDPLRSPAVVPAGMLVAGSGGIPSARLTGSRHPAPDATTVVRHTDLVPPVTIASGTRSVLALTPTRHRLRTLVEPGLYAQTSDLSPLEVLPAMDLHLLTL